jgi:predicted transposase YbfD/YdcC
MILFGKIGATNNQAPRRIAMEYSTLERWEGITETGVIYQLGSLYDRFQNLTDPRKSRGKRYSLLTLLVLIFLAKLCRQDSPVEIADWCANHAGELQNLLQLERAWMPHHNTIRRVFQNIVAEEEFDQLAREYSQSGQEETAGEVLSLDGKRLRGTYRAAGERADHMLSVYDGKRQRVLAQVAVASKENEIGAAPQVLKQVNLSQKVVTGDALHTQRGISEQIITAQGDFLWPVKENQPQMYAAIEQLFAPQKTSPGFGKIRTDFQHAQKVNKGHGRLEKRSITTSAMLNEYLAWPGLAQVYRLERIFTWLRQGAIIKTSREVEYGITSLPRKRANAAKLLEIRRKYWRIETGLHYRRDVTFREDATRMTIGAAGKILAMIHNLVLMLIKRAGFNNAAKGRRWFAGHLQNAFSLLTSSPARL